MSTIDDFWLALVGGAYGARRSAPRSFMGPDAYVTWGSRTPGQPPPPLGDPSGVRYVHLEPPGPGAIILEGPGINKPLY